MTTLAILGSGILGRSLLYTLAKEGKSFEKIVLFHSDTFFSPCSLNSTAIVASRGTQLGLSNLGDLLFHSFHSFSEHFELDAPRGVQKIKQLTGATTKLDAFKNRYPVHTYGRNLFKMDLDHAEEDGYLIDPETYLEWLLDEAKLHLKDKLEIIPDVVKETVQNDRVHVSTLNGRTLSFDKIIFCGGTYNKFWNEVSSKTVQGSYLEFSTIDWSRPSFSLTLDSQNLIYNDQKKILLIGSTSDEVQHCLPDTFELKRIYQELASKVDLKLPEMKLGQIKVGLREKAKKREPYVIQKGHAFYLGGLYKNGFSLSLKMAKTFCHQHF